MYFRAICSLRTGKSSTDTHTILYIMVSFESLNCLPSALLACSCPEAVITGVWGVVDRTASCITIIELGNRTPVPCGVTCGTACNDAARVAVVSRKVGAEQNVKLT